MGDETTIDEIDFAGVKSGLDEGSLILIDVRNQEEIQTAGKIPKSINIPLPEILDSYKNLSEDEFKQRYGFDRTSPGKPIAFSCRAGGRALAAIDNLKSAGIIHNYLLYKGSFTDWVNQGGDKE